MIYQYDLTLSIDIRAAVPDEFTNMMREQARAEDASEFLKQANAIEDDDEFTLFLLKNGLRKNVRQFVQELFENSGIGGTLAPASVVPRDRSVPADAEPVLASEIAQAIPS